MASALRGFLLLSFIFVAIMVAVVGLGYYSYDAASRMEARSEESLDRSNRVVGLKLIDHIEKVIIGTDRNLFEMVRLDDPLEFKELWQRIVRISPVVQTVVVLDDQLQVVHLVSRLRDSSLRLFRGIFLKEIVKDMELKKLALDTHKHLHKSYHDVPYLMSYIRRRASGRDYYIALNMNLYYVVNDIFPLEFKELSESKLVSVRDEMDRVIYGQPAPEDSGIVFVERFPTTLYQWRLQIAPRDVNALRREARARRTYNLALVSSSIGIILAGMIILLVAVRKEAHANQLKSEFISNVTHELKTPLSLIRMFAELLGLGRTTSPERTREYAEIITRESDRLTRLIDNVLDFARIEGGKAAYEFHPGNLTTVVERAVDLSRYRAEQAGTALRTELEAELPDMLIDENAMTLLLLNLLDNALKYGTRGGEEIRVSLKRHGNRVVLTVADNGPGIPREELPRIFDRFYRAKAVRSHSIRGSGIGLSLVKHIAAAHGGSVAAQSELGKGASFEVTIPIRE